MKILVEIGKKKKCNVQMRELEIDDNMANKPPAILLKKKDLNIENSNDIKAKL